MANNLTPPNEHGDGSLALSPTLRLLAQLNGSGRTVLPMMIPSAPSAGTFAMSSAPIVATPYLSPDLFWPTAGLVHQPQAPMLQDRISHVNAMLAAASLEQRRRDAENQRLLMLLDLQRSLNRSSTVNTSAAYLPSSVDPINHGSMRDFGRNSSIVDTIESSPKKEQGARSKVSVPCSSPEEASRVLKILGSTLRTKGDPFLDASAITDPGASISVRGGRSEYFPDKVHLMLDEADSEGKSNIVSWLPHGRAFQIVDPERFLEELMPHYFNSLSQYSSFTRQLHLWGFSRMLSGPDAGAYYHELFLRGHKNLVSYMRRVGAPKGVDRRKIKTQESEDPDLYAMRPLP